MKKSTKRFVNQVCIAVLISGGAVASATGVLDVLKNDTKANAYLEDNNRYILGSKGNTYDLPAGAEIDILGNLEESGFSFTYSDYLTMWKNGENRKTFQLTAKMQVIEPEEPEVPETEAPETEAPETEVPETEAPETEAPETEVPETEAPETEAPETEADINVEQDTLNQPNADETVEEGSTIKEVPIEGYVELTDEIGVLKGGWHVDWKKLGITPKQDNWVFSETGLDNTVGKEGAEIFGNDFIVYEIGPDGKQYLVTLDKYKIEDNARIYTQPVLGNETITITNKDIQKAIASEGGAVLIRTMPFEPASRLYDLRVYLNCDNGTDFTVIKRVFKNGEDIGGEDVGKFKLKQNVTDAGNKDYTIISNYFESRIRFTTNDKTWEEDSEEEDKKDLYTFSDYTLTDYKEQFNSQITYAEGGIIHNKVEPKTYKVDIKGIPATVSISPTLNYGEIVVNINAEKKEDEEKVNVKDKHILLNNTVDTNITLTTYKVDDLQTESPNAEKPGEEEAPKTRAEAPKEEENELKPTEIKVAIKVEASETNNLINRIKGKINITKGMLDSVKVAGPNGTTIGFLSFGTINKDATYGYKDFVTATYNKESNKVIFYGSVFNYLLENPTMITPTPRVLAEIALDSQGEIKDEENYVVDKIQYQGYDEQIDNKEQQYFESSWQYEYNPEDKGLGGIVDLTNNQEIPFEGDNGNGPGDGEENLNGGTDVNGDGNTNNNNSDGQGNLTNTTSGGTDYNNSNTTTKSDGDYPQLNENNQGIFTLVTGFVSMLAGFGLWFLKSKKTTETEKE